MNKPIIAIVGYGAMGREIESIAKQKSLRIGGIYDIDSPLQQAKKLDFDVAIDFSLPEAAADNICFLAEQGKNTVVGTTGWYERLDEMKQIIEKAGTGLVWGSNFSIGMQVFFRIVRNAARLINKVDGYDIMAHEMHHSRKKDSPSGTARSLAEIIIEEFGSKEEAMFETAHGKINPEQIHVSSTRGGEITGRHTVYLDSHADTIELMHNAKNRSGFAAGAVEAALWIAGRKGFYDFRDVMDSILDGK